MGGCGLVNWGKNMVVFRCILSEICFFFFFEIGDLSYIYFSAVAVAAVAVAILGALAVAH
jgi:hypothetical protein